ncbi:MAG: protein kinase, partial [Deltaproteobacteria bacterium]|nr:protein kinase [Deltaproteobacteria bacterium]
MRTVGNYRLKSLIGRGGTSEVYTAEHALLGDIVAIKLLRPELADDSTQAVALVDEGTKVRTIDHPNVVRVLDAGLDPENHGCYLVMEHVAGETLSARLRRDGRFSEAEARRLGAELADGVAAAHARGIVHRDL